MSGIKNPLILFGKGLAMGGADIIPGVSGGTIAFITGIYERLLNAIKSFDLKALKLLFSGKLKDFAHHIDLKFLIPLILGIVTSFLTLAKIVQFLLKNEPVLLWAFFFGLIIASARFVGMQIPKWTIKEILALIIGLAISFYITLASPAIGSSSLLYLFLSGALAICAMILPGISGSFILLLLGSYSIVIGLITGTVDALKEGDFSTLFDNAIAVGVFAVGALLGLLGFSRLLSFILKKYHNTTMALLTGFLIGSLNKIWPWKEVIKYRENSKGEMVPFLEKNVSPSTFTELTGEPNHLIWVIVLALAGFAFVILLEKTASKV